MKLHQEETQRHKDLETSQESGGLQLQQSRCPQETLQIKIIIKMIQTHETSTSHQPSLETSNVFSLDANVQKETIKRVIAAVETNGLHPNSLVSETQCPNRDTLKRRSRTNIWAHEETWSVCSSVSGQSLASSALKTQIKRTETCSETQTDAKRPGRVSATKNWPDRSWQGLDLGPLCPGALHLITCRLIKCPQQQQQQQQVVSPCPRVSCY